MTLGLKALVSVSMVQFAACQSISACCRAVFGLIMAE